MKMLWDMFNGQPAALVNAPGVSAFTTHLDVSVYRGEKTVFFQRQRMPVLLVAAADRNGDETSTLRPAIFSLQ